MWPELPEWADPRELDPEVRRDLRGLSKEGAEFVGAHLLAAGTLAEEEPELAWRHARAARSKGGRIAVVRETVGLVAYRAGEWAEAIAELRAARRMGGGAGHIPVLADCERALGHPEKAIELARSAETAELDEESSAELRIVVAGARADLGQIDAALAHLEAAELTTAAAQPYSARLYFAYADLLERAGRYDEALDWFMKAADLDADDETDAAARASMVAELSTEQVPASEPVPLSELVPASEPASSEPVPTSEPVPATGQRSGTYHDQEDSAELDSDIGTARVGEVATDEPPVPAEPAGPIEQPAEPAPPNEPSTTSETDESMATSETDESMATSETDESTAIDEQTTPAPVDPAHSPLFSHRPEAGS